MCSMVMVLDPWAGKTMPGRDPGVHAGKAVRGEAGISRGRKEEASW